MITFPDQELSYWQASLDRLDYPKLEVDMTVDVAIIGGGITGLTAGYLLKQAGKTVAIIEKDTIVSGTTGNTTGKVTSQHGLTYADLSERLGEATARTYGQANEAAIARIEALIKKEKIDCDWRREDNYVYTCDSLQVKKYQQEAEAAARLGLPASFEKTSALPFGIAGAVRFKDQATFHAAKYAAALAARIHGYGSHVFENTRAIGIRDGTPGRVKTPNGTVLARDIIVATNVPTFPLLARGGYCVLEYPLKSYVVAMRIKTKLPGMYISTDDDEYSILPVQTKSANLLLIGGESHIRGAKLNVDTRYDRLAVYSKYRFRAPTVAYKWSAWDYQAYDDIPLVGQMYPWSKHLYVASAFRKWGLSNSMVAGMILRDLLTDQQNNVTKIYTPQRGSSIRSIPRVAKQYLMGWPPFSCIVSSTKSKGAIMANIKLNPYIFFKGNCREAMEFYKAIFGGELTTQAYEDVPTDFPGKDAMKGQLMHAALTGGDIELMGSDTQEASTQAAKVTISLSGDEAEKLTAFFDKLSEGVEVQYPLKKEYWGDTFGSLTDKYGVDWMVNISAPTEA
jgi:glycine/D-amino acid oxidase-like deaminating enzyme/uncharacterized glyoxalase superfamily protein PhnB